MKPSTVIAQSAHLKFSYLESVTLTVYVDKINFTQEAYNLRSQSRFLFPLLARIQTLIAGTRILDIIVLDHEVT